MLHSIDYDRMIASCECQRTDESVPALNDSQIIEAL
jgi:hypothetical protein